MAVCLKQRLVLLATLITQTVNMIAGIETVENGFPALTGNVVFNGEGKGTFGLYDASNELAERKTVFDVTATADFDAGTVGLNIKNTQCVSANCSSLFTASDYNFSTSLGFTGNSMRKTTTFSVDSSINMSGIVDARFYGAGAKEFGGTFGFNNTLTNDAYYYGAFGAQRDSIFTNLSPDTSIATQKTVALAGAHTSLTTAAVDTSGDSADDKAFTMNALSVQNNLSENYSRTKLSSLWASSEITQATTISKVSNSSTTLTFNAAGNISAVTAYLSGDGNSDYTADTDTGATSTLFGSTITGAVATQATDINVDRSSVFGFAADYMAYISWNLIEDENTLDNGLLSDNINTISGMMLAGIETTDAEIFTTAKSKFTGKGTGVYGSVVNGALASYNTDYVVTAIVDYTALNMGISTSETACIGDCTGINVPTELNFNTVASFSDGGNTPAATNAISGTIMSGDLSGTLDARFYGTGTDKANELGGTFILADSSNNSYYYGAFGTSRNNVAPFAFGITDSYISNEINAGNSQVASLGGSYVSLSEVSTGANTDGTAKTATLDAVAVNSTKNIDYERPSNSIAWTETEELKIDRTIMTSQIANSGSNAPAVSLTFDGDGNISGVTAFADVDYIATGTASSSTSFTGTATIGSKVNTVNVERGSSFFGFNSEYMAYIGWNASVDADLTVANTTTTANSNSLNGAMIAGVETDVVDIPTENQAQFSGQGTGVYTSVTEQYNTNFVVATTVDFTSKTADFATSNTVCTGTCVGVTVPSALDFSITGAVFDDGGNTVNNISFSEDTASRQIRLDARFYGADSAEEMGGTFALANKNGGAIDYHYHGAFGGKISPIAFFDDQDSPIGGKPGLSTDNFYIGDDNRTVVGYALMVHSNRVVEYSRADAAASWGAGDLSAINIETNNNKATNSPRISIEQGSGGRIKNLELYFDDKKYTSNKEFEQ